MVGSIQIGWEFTFKSVGVAGEAGPRVKIHNFDGALQYIKVGFVFSRFPNELDPTDKPLVPSRYSTSSLRSLYTIPSGYTGGQLIYTASYIFDKTNVFNNPVSIKRATANT